MTLEELAKEVNASKPEEVAPSVTPHRDPGAVLRFPSRQQRHRKTQLLPGGHVVLVENEYGFVEYRILQPDGHLGALED